MPPYVYYVVFLSLFLIVNAYQSDKRKDETKKELEELLERLIEEKDRDKEHTRKNSDTDNICKLPKKVGPCRAAFPKFYFDKFEDKCMEFIYGGCDGNANNFDTLEECEATCPSRRTDLR